MYRIQKTPDLFAVLENGSEVTPLVTLKDEHGGVAHIITDDHCYVLLLERGEKEGAAAGVCRMVYHWFPEAQEALQKLVSERRPANFGPIAENVGWDEIPVGGSFRSRGSECDLFFTKIDKDRGTNGIHTTTFEPSSNGYDLFSPLAVRHNPSGPDVSTPAGQVDEIQHILNGKLEGLCSYVTNDCHAELNINVTGNGADELYDQIMRKLSCKAGDVYEYDFVRVMVNKDQAEGAATFFARAVFKVPPATAIKYRKPAWINLTDHSMENTLNSQVQVLRLDAPGHGGAHHDYAIVSGVGDDDQWHDGEGDLHHETLYDVQNRSYPIYKNGRVSIYVLRDAKQNKTDYAIIGYHQNGEVSDVIRAGQVSLIRFQNGPVQEGGVNGLSNEALITVLLDRMRGFQSGRFACRENDLALTKLQEALLWLHERTQGRVTRGVEGRSVV